MTRRGATHSTRLRVQFALLAGVVAIAAAVTFITLASSSTPTVAQTPPDKFTALDVRGSNVCAIKESDGNPKCWGRHERHFRLHVAD